MGSRNEPVTGQDENTEVFLLSSLFLILPVVLMITGNVTVFVTVK